MAINGRAVMALVADINGETVDVGTVEVEVQCSHIAYEDGRAVAYLRLGSDG